MALDSKGNQVGYGDWVRSGDLLVRLVRVSETPKGIIATGAYVELVGYGRVAKTRVDLANATLVMRSDGTVVS